MTCVANSEWPPISKKLSVIDTCSTRSTCAHTPHSTSSTAVRGVCAGSGPASTGLVGAGRARRSSFPLGVNGSCSNSTNAAGSMYSGRCSRSRLRNSLAVRESRPTRPHQIRHQPLITRFIFPGHHQTLPYSLVLPQPRLYLPQLNPVSPDLHLLVNPPQILQFSLPVPPRQVSRPVEPASRPSPAIRDKPFSRQLRSL